MNHPAVALIVLGLLIAGFVFTLWHAGTDKLKLWVPVLLIAIALIMWRLGA